ncbi:MAG: hypothetical protein HYV59_03135 [Planctomycetes bacterium]|nr:hypothetical protein [Planctomycetota bacterium]
MDKKRVGDMTVGELKTLIRNVVKEAIDPDYGLELRTEIEKELKESLQSKERIPVEEVAEKLGLKW